MQLNGSSTPEWRYSNFPIATAVGLLVLTALSIVVGVQKLISDILAAGAYFFLVAGLLLRIIEITRLDLG